MGQSGVSKAVVAPSLKTGSSASTVTSSSISVDHDTHLKVVSKLGEVVSKHEDLQRLY